MTGTALRKLRKELDLTQEALAHLLGVSFATVNRWETVEGISGPRGAVLSVLQALSTARRKDPRLAQRIREWESRGQPYLLHKVFELAYGERGR